MPSPRIIVANDNALYLELIKELLIDEGYPHVRCTRGSAAFDLVVQEQPDLVLLGINSAQANAGWRTLDLLRLHPATAHIPVIVCATDPWVLRMKGAQLEEMRYVTFEQPFDLEVLVAKVRATLGP